MACGCELRGAAARQNSIYLPGVYASLAGLRGLGVAADGTSAPAAGGLNDEQKAELRAKLQRVAQAQEAGTDAVTRQVANIVAIVASAITTIISLPFLQIPAGTQQDIRRVFNWIRAFFSEGRQLPPLTGDDLAALRAICLFWSSYGGAVSGGIDTAESVAQAAAQRSGTGRLSDTDAALYSMLQFAARTITGWCNDTGVQALIRPGPAWSPEAVAQAEAAVAAQRAALNPQQMAINAFRNAMSSRWISESTAPSIASIRWGSRSWSRPEFDCLTSAALLETSRAYVAMFPGQPLPRFGPRLFIPSPQNYIATPPALFCPPAGGGGGGTIVIPPPDGGGPIMTPTGGGGGGGGAGIAIAGAGLLAALMFFRR